MLRLSALIAVLAAVATPALAQNSIRPGQTVRGELTASDPTLDDGSHYDCFSVQTRRGQNLQIDQMSDAFDSYLTVGAGSCANPTNPASDDDGGGGVNSRVVRVGDGGILTIRVNSLEGGKTGAYQLRVTEVAGGAPAAPANGAGATSIGVGQTIRGELSGSDPALSDGSHFDCFQVQTRRGQSLQIDQISNAFDSYLSIGSGSCGALTGVVNDDDGGDGLNSRLRFDGDGSVLSIRVNSIEGGETGAYQLTVSEASPGATPEPFGNVNAESLRNTRPTTLPRVTSEWDVEPPTCAAAYRAWMEMLVEGVAPREFGNTASIDYSGRYEEVYGKLRTEEERAVVGLYKMNFRSMALVGAIGVAPNGQPNGGRPLAEYLSALGACDREYGFSPTTTY
jgi:hypothetical protein